MINEIYKLHINLKIVTRINKQKGANEGKLCLIVYVLY